MRRESLDESDILSEPGPVITQAQSIASGYSKPFLAISGLQDLDCAVAVGQPHLATACPDIAI
jgi:hypothetical protein